MAPNNLPDDELPDASPSPIQGRQTQSSNIATHVDDDALAEEDTAAAAQTSAAGTHPYMTYNSLASSNFEAGPNFVNSYFAKQHNASTHQNQRQGPAAAAIITCKQALTPSENCSCASCRGSSGVSPMLDAQNKSQHLADKGMLAGWSESLLAANPDVDDDVTSRKIEDEIRSMMRRVHVKHTDDEVEEFEGMGETPEELRRIAQALQRCMALRNKYMDTSHQHENGNPKSRPGWTIYPPPPLPAWHHAGRSSSKAAPQATSVEFDIDKIDIPPADQCVFAMGNDGVYAVYESEELRASGAQPITSAPSIREFYMDLNFVLDTISDGP
ncbi:AMP deaminase, partial [Coemansia asiatica]